MLDQVHLWMNGHKRQLRLKIDARKDAQPVTSEEMALMP